MEFAEASSSSIRGRRPNLHQSAHHSRSQSHNPINVLNIPNSERDTLAVTEDGPWPPSQSNGTSPFKARPSKLLAASQSSKNFHSHQRSSPGPSRDSSNSSLSSSSTSSASTSTPLIAPSSTTGRKVAANLQLFKETAPDVVEPRRSLSRQPTLVPNGPETATTSRQPLSPTEEEEEVRETQFVKRTAWPEREAAAVRRGKSAATSKRTTLVSPTPDRDWESAERNRPSRERPPSTPNQVFQDLREWRQDTLERGRKRDRTADAGSDSEEGWARSVAPDPINIPQLPSFSKRGSSHSINTYHSAHSLPRSSPPGHERKRSTVSFTLEDVDDPVAHDPVALSVEAETTPPPPYPRVETSIPSPSLESPWSSDSESAWDTASVASSIATTTSPSIRERRPRNHHHHSQEALDDVDGVVLTPPRQPGDDQEDEDMNDEDAYGTLDELDPSSSTPLPNVPLRPFRNQVGGHSAIYKFTKRAVCKVSFFLYTRANLMFLFVFFFHKPLVSRENLFYEAVESAAPPLLGFIPRYLGVMLVNYRKVRKPVTNHAAHSESAHTPGTTVPIEHDETLVPQTGVTPASLSSPPRPTLRKSVTAQGLSASERARERADMYSSPAHSPPRSPSRVHDEEAHHASGEETEDAEQPVVQLDSNPHILPGWMLRGRREYYRSLPGAMVLPRGLPGVAPLLSEDKNPLSKLQHAHRAVVSNPDLSGIIQSSAGNV